MSVATTAASESGLAYVVPPVAIPATRPCASRWRSRWSRSSAVIPYAPTGTPPPRLLPSVTMSGVKPQARVQPPYAAVCVCVSSSTSSAPCSRVSRRTSSWKPGTGRTTPTFVSAGSVITAATASRASTRASASASLKGTIRVSAAARGFRPRLPGCAPLSSPSTSVSSRCPW